MPRRRKPTTNAVETTVPPEVAAEAPVSPPASETDERTAVTRPESQDSFAAELGASDPTTAVPAGPDTAPPPVRGRFRSWVADVGRGYHRLTDEEAGQLVLQFDHKPAADVLTAIKGAGFHYHPDYHGQTHAWVRRNDFQARLDVEAIEKLIGTLPQRDSAVR